ncbi:MAG TPA: hypothetical protein VGU46_12250 [Acidobacteriaceae bacterium]|nr:hypothetical protein [Acidobacteriaceae bacterium]
MLAVSSVVLLKKFSVKADESNVTGTVHHSKKYAVRRLVAVDVGSADMRLCKEMIAKEGEAAL